jgi:2-oxoglutarate/2-oxoacid ferredoxin oxidoreductase subunit beta
MGGCSLPSKQSNQDLITLGKRKNLQQSYESEDKLVWCGGCGNYGIRNALIRALTLENLDPGKDVVICYDVGCSGNGSDKIDAYTIHGLHGRVISLAAGAALANQNIRVVAEAGDGATFSEGIGHFVHAIRSNYRVVFILHNNENYALTTGQPSSTTPKGRPMNSAPDGVVLDPINPCDMALSLGASFVARTFSGDVKHVTKTLQQALNHNGFAFIEVMQVCTTYNRQTPQEWYWDRIQNVEEQKGYDVKNRAKALASAKDMDKKINIGLLYQNTETPSFMDRLIQREGITTSLTEEVKHHNIAPLMKDFY